jgi:hypothetical protein
MVDLSAYLDPEDDEPPGGGDAEDFAALKACLKALADAVASTNLAVITGGQGDAQGAFARVQASVAALKRFHDAFTVLENDGSKGAAPEAAEEEE